MAYLRRRTTAAGEVRYDVRWRLDNGETRNQTFKTRRDADTFRRELEHEQVRGLALDPRSAQLPVAELAARWLASNPSKRPSTLRTDEYELSARILPVLGDAEIGAVTPTEVQALVNQWAGTIGARSVRRAYGVVHALFAYAVEMEWLARSPWRRVKLPRVDPTTRRLPEPEELAALADALPAEYRIAVWLGAVLGLRFSEVAGLRVGRLDLLAGRLTVAESVTRGPDGEPSFGPPKSHAGRRTLALSSELCRLLAEHLADRGLSTSDVDRFVLEAPGGGPLRYENFRTRIWAPTCEAVGLKGLGFHDLRRASATALVLEGVDLKTAQTRLGHSDPRLTIGIYAQAISAADHAAAEVLATRFLPRRPAPADDPDPHEPAASRPAVEPVAAAVDEASVASVTPLSRHRRDTAESRDMAATWSPSEVLRMASAEKKPASSREFAGGGDIVRLHAYLPQIERCSW